jgi:hypothetical protein
MSGAILAAAILAAADASQALDPQDAQCHVIRYAVDGTRRETPPTRPYVRSAGVAASAHASGGGRARSSTSVAAGSSNGGEATAVVRTRSGGRAITKTYDKNGCTVLIDERPDRGE